jgi:predicted MarR family transcription regulator
MFFAGKRLTGIVDGVRTSLDVKVLFLVYDDERALRQSDLARLLDVERSMVWRSVERLRAAGLVTGHREGRNAFVRATQSGRGADRPRTARHRRTARVVPCAAARTNDFVVTTASID